METLATLQIQLNHTAAKSFVSDLKANGIKFYTITPTRLIMMNSPKVRMAIQMVKERFGARAIYITDANC